MSAFGSVAEAQPVIPKNLNFSDYFVGIIALLIGGGIAAATIAPALACPYNTQASNEQQQTAQAQTPNSRAASLVVAGDPLRPDRGGPDQVAQHLQSLRIKHGRSASL